MGFGQLPRICPVDNSQGEGSDATEKAPRFEVNLCRVMSMLNVTNIQACISAADLPPPFIQAHDPIYDPKSTKYF